MLSCVEESGSSTLPAQILPLRQTLKNGARNIFISGVGRLSPLTANTLQPLSLTVNIRPGLGTFADRLQTLSSSQLNQTCRMDGFIHHVTEVGDRLKTVSGRKPPILMLLTINSAS